MSYLGVLHWIYLSFYQFLYSGCLSIRSAFGHLDGIHASVRSAHQAIQINDAHVRFERITEAQPKSAGCVEEALRLSFKEFDMNKLPVDFEELKSAPPSGWTHNIEQRVIRSSSFSEYEMISQPLCILTVVSTADLDPVACMQELCSAHHAPGGFKTVRILFRFNTEIVAVKLMNRRFSGTIRPGCAAGLHDYPRQ